jgi:hypothetical protein
LVLSCFTIQCFEETKDCSLEGSKKEQQIDNRYHPRWIDRFNDLKEEAEEAEEEEEEEEEEEVEEN